MIKYMAAIIFLAALLIGCKSTPDGVLSEEKMVAVFTDINIAEARLKTVGIFGDSAKKMAPVLYEEVYKTHQVTREEFIKSYDYYISHPKEFEDIIDKMQVELSKRESGIK